MFTFTFTVVFYVDGMLLLFLRFLFLSLSFIQYYFCVLCLILDSSLFMWRKTFGGGPFSRLEGK